MARTRSLAAIGGFAIAAMTLASCSSGTGSDDGSQLSIYIDSAESTVALWEALTDAYAEANPDVQIDLELHPSGSEGDNLIKTRLSTGEMNDLFLYNTGSLFQALTPDQTLTDLSDQPWADAFSDDFVSVVSTDEGFYGVPVGASFAGAVNYNKDVYADLGLEVPKDWDEFAANNEAILAAGIAPVAQTYGDPWTAQVAVLADFYNISAADPEWAEQYTAGEAKYVDEPAIAGFQHLQELYDDGFVNEDFASATIDDGVRMLAEGTAAHYLMLTNYVTAGLATNYPDAADSIGAFPLPGEDAANNGLTVWMPNAVYVPNTTEGAQLEAAKDFLAWLATPEACDLQAGAAPIGGPFVVDGCELPSDTPALVADMQPFFDAGDTGVALEFLSPIKGPALEQVTVEVGSGIRDAASGAALYDEDVEKQAAQLGLDW